MSHSFHISKAVTGYFYTDRLVFLILEYAPKGELYTYLKSVGKFDDEKAATVRI